MSMQCSCLQCCYKYQRINSHFCQEIKLPRAQDENVTSVIHVVCDGDMKTARKSSRLTQTYYKKNKNCIVMNQSKHKCCHYNCLIAITHMLNLFIKKHVYSQLEQQLSNQFKLIIIEYLQIITLQIIIFNDVSISNGDLGELSGKQLVFDLV